MELVLKALAARVRRARRKILTLSFFTWGSVGAMIVLSSVQPTAYGLDFPMVTHLVLPSVNGEVVAQEPSVALFSQLTTKVSISANALAEVSLASRNIVIAHKPAGAKVVAKAIMQSEYNWGSHQFYCLNTLWERESHWNYQSHNRSSGAHGIPQAMPASKMDSIATDWRTNPVTQIRWGLHYIEMRYSTPCSALVKFQRSNYY